MNNFTLMDVALWFNMDFCNGFGNLLWENGVMQIKKIGNLLGSTHSILARIKFRLEIRTSKNFFCVNSTFSFKNIKLWFDLQFKINQQLQIFPQTFTSLIRVQSKKFPSTSHRGNQILIGNWRRCQKERKGQIVSWECQNIYILST